MPQRLGTVGSGTPLNAPPDCMCVVCCASPTMHCHKAWGQWAVELLQFTATMPLSSGQRNLCNAVPHFLGAIGSGAPAMHSHIAGGHWVVEILQCTATLLGGHPAVELQHCTTIVPRCIGQWNCCNAPPHYLRAARGRTAAMLRHNTCGRLVVELLQCMATLPRGSGQRKSCNQAPHCVGAVGGATDAMLATLLGALGI